MRLRLMSLTTMLLASLVAAPALAQQSAPKPAPKARTAADALTPADSPNPYSRRTFLGRGKDKNIEVVFLGDSITEFWQHKGKEVWEKYYTKYNAANFGVSSERTEHTLGHLAGGVLDAPRPKVVVILIGTNNIGNSPVDKPEWAAAGVKKIVETVHKKLPQTKVLLLGVLPRDKKNSGSRKAIEQINAIISKLDDGKKTRYLDLGPKFLDENGEIPKEIMPDGLHPEIKGYEIWAESMQPLLDEMMAAPEKR
ncbi:MAG TPA: GDSL-type esterase/lipase family protein [Tepidisphaeraceae bacterium]